MKRTNEIGAVIPLLETLPDVAGRTITADALLTQRRLADYLLGRGADYLFTVNRRDIVRLSITLQYVEPRVARLMDVPLDTYLDNLHLYIQAAMGWGNDHAWGFDARRYGQGAHRGPEEWDEQLDETLLDAIAFLKGKREFTYVYDYGDRWEHRIRIGTIQPARDDRRYPYLVSGTGRCPLEDSGGVWGYRELMRALEDPSSKYREHFPDFHREGATWDPEDADLDARRSPLAPFSE